MMLTLNPESAKRIYERWRRELDDNAGFAHQWQQEPRIHNVDCLNLLSTLETHDPAKETKFE